MTDPVTILLPPRMRRLDGFERGLQGRPLCWSEKISAKSSQPNCGEGPIRSIIEGDEKIHPSSWRHYWHWPCRRELPESQRSFL